MWQDIRNTQEYRYKFFLKKICEDIRKKKQYRHNKKALKCEKKPEKEKGIGIRNMFEKLKKT